MRKITAPPLAVGIYPSYCSSLPSIYLIPTVDERHRHFRPMVIQAGRKYSNLDEYYQKKSSKFWDNFYKRHKNKDRHCLEKDWGQYFSDDAHFPNGKVVLEVGCGAGNTIFLLVAAYPKLYVQACDISPRAVKLVKSHLEFREDRVNAFVCDVTVDKLCNRINPSSVDVITLPDGCVLLRDYTVGDFAQETCSSGLLQEELP